MISTLLLALTLQTAPQAAAPASDAMKAYEEGNAALEKKENDKALAAFDRAISLDGKNGNFHHGRCRVLAALQRHDEAIASCSTALTLKPSDVSILVDRGHYYINTRRLDLAYADLSDVAKNIARTGEGPDGATRYALFYHLSLVQYLRGEFGDAATSYEGCVRQATTPDNKTSCQAWQFLALTRAGRKADAQKLLDAFTYAPDPKDPKAEPSAYVLRLQLFKGAVTEEEVAKAMAKDNLQLPTVAYSIGIWHLLNGHGTKAREHFEKAVAPPAQQSAFGAVASWVELQRMKS